MQNLSIPNSNEYRPPTGMLEISFSIAAKASRYTRVWKSTVLKNAVGELQNKCMRDTGKQAGKSHCAAAPSNASFFEIHERPEPRATAHAQQPHRRVLVMPRRYRWRTLTSSNVECTHIIRSKPPTSSAKVIKQMQHRH